MRLNNCMIYGLKEALIASGLPMKTEFDAVDFAYKAENDFESGINRAVKLGNVQTGTGHDSFLKLITVHMNVTTSIKVWTEMQRYHFFDIGSSQSTMHRASKMDIKKCCNNFVDSKIIEILEELQACYNDGAISFEEFIYNIPVGFELTARVATNYLQLKTMYQQRKNHKLQEWRDFCSDIENFPYFTKLCLGE